MGDFIYLLVVGGFAVLTLLFMALCEWLMGGTNERN